jgi:hypothetical protein
MKILKDSQLLDYCVELFMRLCIYTSVGQKPRGLRMQAEIRHGSSRAFFFMVEATVLDAEVGAIPGV